MKIRLVFDSDIPQLALLHTQCFTTPYDLPWSEQQFRDTIIHPQSLAFIAEDDGCRGVILAYQASESADILTFAVDPHFQHQGIGRALMDTLRAHIPTKSCFVEVAETNTNAISFYQKYGFKPIGKRPGYYTARGTNSSCIDALVFSIAPFMT